MFGLKKLKSRVDRLYQALCGDFGYITGRLEDNLKYLSSYRDKNLERTLERLEGKLVRLEEKCNRMDNEIDAMEELLGIDYGYQEAGSYLEKGSKRVDLKKS